jgi:hypothetical protein
VLSTIWRGVAPSRSRPQVTIEVGPQTFEGTYTRVHRFLLWSWTRVVQRTFVIQALSLRELLIVHEHLRSLGHEMDGLAPREALYIALGDRDALRLEHGRARELWNAWREANLLAVGKAESGSSSRDGSRSVLDLVFDLERWPFNFALERILEMSAAEATARLARWYEIRAKEATNAGPDV